MNAWWKHRNLTFLKGYFTENENSVIIYSWMHKKKLEIWMFFLKMIVYPEIEKSMSSFTHEENRYLMIFLDSKITIVSQFTHECMKKIQKGYFSKG